MFAGLAEGMFIMKMIEFQAGAKVMVAHTEPGYGAFVGTVVEFDDKVVKVSGVDGRVREFARTRYEFFVPDEGTLATLAEVERALNSKSAENRAEYMPPIRLRATTRFVENLRRKGTPLGTLADPDKLAEKLAKEFVLFKFLSEYEQRRTAMVVVSKMGLMEEATPENKKAVALIVRHVGEKKLAADVWAALAAGTKLRTVMTMFPSLDADMFGAILVSLVRLGALDRNRLRECAEDQALAESVMLKSLGAKE
jgi:hypothetical protein